MNWCRKAPEKTALIDVAADRAMSYGELDELTAKVYAYLSERGIGRESFVMIALPRGIGTVIAAIGVWRAGAAYVIVEEGTPAERKDFIYQDCGCRLLLNQEVFEQIQHTPRKEGYAETDLHDAAYAIYTSGTTGNPKGAIHEYGTLEDNLSHFKHDGKYLMGETDRFLLVTPFSFIAGTMVINLMPYQGVTLIIAPLTVVRDPEKLLSCMADHRVTATFFTPSLLKLNPRFHPELRTLVLSSEAVENVYRDDVAIYNIYAQSETGYMVTVFKIDRSYELTPVGKPQCPGRQVFILNDDGGEVQTGGIGEVCFENPYFRGYMNLPEENAKALRGGIYHSGDMGRRLPDGNLVILGRDDDMVKVNGNRVEPGEIEKAMKDVLHLSWAAVRVFTDEERVSICGYYTDDIAFNPLEAKLKLKKKLPDYMVPTNFIRLSEIPLNANGKLSRKDLPRPERTAGTVPYTAPRGDIEKRLCEAAQKVLGIDRIGALDDLYAHGLDSIGAIKLVAESGLDYLTTVMVFDGITPEKIAKIYQQEASSGGLEMLRESEATARMRAHPLLMDQLAAFDWQLNAPHSTMNNCVLFYRLGSEVDLPRLAAALERVLKAHGIFSTVLAFNEDGELVQKYAPDTDKKVVVERITEAELVDLREHLIYYYKLIGSPFFRFRVFETERGGYLFIDMHHLVVDGISKVILLKDISDSYEGKHLKEDRYFSNLSRLERASELSACAEAGAYYTAREKAHEWSRYPRLDGKPVFDGVKSISFLLPVDEAGFAKMTELYSIRKNTFMLAVSTLSLAAYNAAEHISMKWTYNGRESKMEEDIVGMLIRDITFYLDLEEGMTLGGFLKEVKDQERLGLSYSRYPHTNPVREPNMSLYVIYQSELGEEENTVLNLTGEELPNPDNTMEELMDMEIYDTEEGTEVKLFYLPSCYQENSIQRFRRMIMKSAALLMQYAEEPGREIAQLLSVIRE